jgi:eukaryotic-like serine/threonine-protein kinase
MTAVRVGFDGVQVWRHPNIVRLLDHWIDDSGHPHIVMELAEGGDLPHYVSSQMRIGRWSVPRCCELMLGLMKAVEYVHSRGMVHRDIKPENVLVDAHGSALLGDFGLARTSSATMTRGTGTRLYMSPEQLNEKDYGPPADVWSAGIVFYQLACDLLPGDTVTDLSATSPFGDAGGADTLLVNIMTKPPRLDRVPRSYGDDFTALLTSMLRFDPVERPTSMEVAARMGLIVARMLKGSEPGAGGAT